MLAESAQHSSSRPLQKLQTYLRANRLIAADTLIDWHHILKSVVWFFGLVFLAWMTIKDFIPLLDDYQRRNVAIQVDVIVGDDRFKPPTIVVSIPFYKDEMEEGSELTMIAEYFWRNDSTEECGVICAKLAENGWDVWTNLSDSVLNSSFGFEGVYQTLSLAFFDKLIDEIEEEDFLDSKYAAWNAALFSSAMNVLHWSMLYDFGLPPSFAGSRQFYLETFSKFENISQLEPLMTAVLKSICAKMRFNEWNYANEFDDYPRLASTKCENLVLNTSSMYSVDPYYGLYVQLPTLVTPTTKGYRFRLADDPFWKKKKTLRKFAVDRPSPLENRSSVRTASPESNKYLSIYPDISVLYLATWDPFYSSYLSRSLLNRSGLNVTIRYAVQMRAKDLRTKSTPCIYEDSITCFTKCTKMWLVHQCQCIPFSYARGLPAVDPRLPYCSPVIYAACNMSRGLATIPDDMKHGCLDECKNSCEYTSYSWQISQEYEENSSSNNDSNGCEINLMMFPMFTTFAEFTWTVKSTPEQFISQMGGIVNFYLGFSGLSIFASIIVFVEFVRLACARRKEDPTVERPRTVMGEGVDTGWKWADHPGSFGHSQRFWTRRSASGKRDAPKDDAFLDSKDKLLVKLERENDERKSEILILRRQLEELRSEIRRGLKS